jgi:hypothetical protein
MAATAAPKPALMAEGARGARGGNTAGEALRSAEPFRSVLTRKGRKKGSRALAARRAPARGDGVAHPTDTTRAAALGKKWG